MTENAHSFLIFHDSVLDLKVLWVKTYKLDSTASQFEPLKLLWPIFSHYQQIKWLCEKGFILFFPMFSFSFTAVISVEFSMELCSVKELTVPHAHHETADRQILQLAGELSEAFRSQRDRNVSSGVGGDQSKAKGRLNKGHKHESKWMLHSCSANMFAISI